MADIRKSIPFLVLIIPVFCLVFALQCGEDNTTNAGNNNDDITDPPDTNLTAYVANHDIVDYYEYIPDSIIDLIQNNLNVYYGHTSHGSQLVTGMNMLVSFQAEMQLPSLYEVGDDLGHLGDTSWAPMTRTYLNSHPDVNVVIWSWCGGCSDNTVEGINAYLNKYNELEQAYPDVTFIYMTGHLDGTGVDGNLYARNNQIRSYCETNNKWLFDFADIESYDPNGTLYPDDSDGCSWCEDWCATHDCPDCSSCAHSHCYNCYLKGKALWGLLARVVGWDGSIN